MTSPFETAEFVGGPLDGQSYERRGDQFPARLEMEVEGYMYGYVARLNYLGGVIYKFTGRLSVVAVR